MKLMKKGSYFNIIHLICDVSDIEWDNGQDIASHELSKSI